jgi:hypothetical protein
MYCVCYRLLSQHDVGLIDVLQTDPAYKQLLAKICSKGTLKESMLKRTTALQVSLIILTVTPPGVGSVMGLLYEINPKNIGRITKIGRENSESTARSSLWDVILFSKSMHHLILTDL